ncbi:hypothetical protein A9K55_008015 [Cordyceps militaris]|uniref:HNH nuclease domain-containing protein n=1 Tax=Cordyceps militaris TaxID=73501 RepID=A0A2H4SH05_CORMI|nr:hypothetical protein A9K55_008015 [Cordyceps militaris]
MAHVKKQPTVRSRYTRPAHPEAPLTSGGEESKKIRLRHPGYADSDNILISLVALDDGGLHHETARVACAVLADFRWNGYLSLTTTGEPIEEGPDDILTEGNYYFHVPDLPKYDVVANFGSCIFPHGRLPPSWLSPSLRLPNAIDQPRETSCNNVVLTRDVSCRVTNATLCTQGAHLLPKSEESWYTKNSMFQYSAWEEKGTPDDPRNVILLRSDAHTLFNAKRFLIVPKRDKWLTHVLYGKPQDELAQSFHNIHLQPLTDISVEFLFARFVWTIHALSTFTLSGGKRALLVLKAGETQRQRIEVTGMQYKTELTARSKTASRTPSPNKRRRDDTGIEAAMSQDFDDQERGRPRKRRMSSETASTVSLEEYEQYASVFISLANSDEEEIGCNVTTTQGPF